MVGFKLPLMHKMIEFDNADKNKVSPKMHNGKFRSTDSSKFPKIDDYSLTELNNKILGVSYNSYEIVESQSNNINNKNNVSEDSEKEIKPYTKKENEGNISNSIENNDTPVIMHSDNKEPEHSSEVKSLNSSEK